jgi:metal-sulfur cluster biosynthetic enzyme
MKMPDVRRLVRIGTPDDAAPNETMPASTIAGPLSEQMIWSELRTVHDPEIPANIVDLGLIYSVKVTALEGDQKRVEIDMTLTAPGCAMADSIKSAVQDKMLGLPQVKEISVNIVFYPPWHPGLISESVKTLLGL